MSKLFYIYFISIIIPFSIQNVISVGYEDNFMRFSDFEMDANLYENNTENDIWEILDYLILQSFHQVLR